MLDKFNLSGKVAVVTGANTGIGQGIAWAMAEAGAKVVGVGRSDMTATREYIEKIGGEFKEVMADLSKPEKAQEVFDNCLACFGKVDILVNNAGVIKRHDAQDFPADDWNLVINTNLNTIFFLSQAAAKYWIANNMRGKIVSTSSLLAYQGGIRVPAYTASKHAVSGMTKALCNDWAKYGINVNAIAPGYVVTNNTSALRADEARYNAILERIPHGRWAQPADIAGAAVFLASEAADYVNGITLPVDGGWLAR
ncbi:MAG: 2-dehydro-3-deoxy-D-gluconate 5-dehydrogenase KduD [Firmicutes bacterium]|nr:2-dehydro-3-deoxy-D-gluconate 5-dehydrogenase KduD [Bacillota bacterium]